MVIFAKTASYFGKIHKNPRLNRKNSTSNTIQHNERISSKIAIICKAKTKYTQHNIKHKQSFRRHTQPSHIAPYKKIIKKT